MLLWDASCIVHEEFKSDALRGLRAQYPDAAVLVHPESPLAVIEQATVVGSTSRLIRASQELEQDCFIVATDRGIFYKMQQLSPHKTFLEAPTGGVGATCRSCGHCPWMAMNTLDNLVTSLQNSDDEILVLPQIADQARSSLQRMLNFSRQHHRAHAGS